VTTIGMHIIFWFVALSDAVSVSSSLLSNSTKQTSHDLTSADNRFTAQLTTGENGGGREMVVSAADYTCRSVEYL